MGTTIQEEARQGLGLWYDALPQDAIVAAENALRQVDTEAQSGAYILPNREDIFRAFQLTPPQNVKFVLVGQDPYPTIGHAMGLAFSVRRDVKPFPRSLQNILRSCATTWAFQCLKQVIYRHGPNRVACC